MESTYVYTYILTLIIMYCWLVRAGVGSVPGREGRIVTGIAMLHVVESSIVALSTDRPGETVVSFFML